ncbi:uncharacterized protein LOC128670205 [Plodia interpunctella]|uniref:uncharacterized protein LOC128670205 n=1 Tax=Plodia interpunctella TaxID=58824 RepID=UPI002367E203|nr:uncharacterized protein LOC128670205 [Plodia interpunctella]
MKFFLIFLVLAVLASANGQWDYSCTAQGGKCVPNNSENARHCSDILPVPCRDPNYMCCRNQEPATTECEYKGGECMPTTLISAQNCLTSGPYSCHPNGQVILGVFCCLRWKYPTHQGV